MYALNPLAGAIAGFRAALLGTPGPTWTQLGLHSWAVGDFRWPASSTSGAPERVFADVA